MKKATLFLIVIVFLILQSCRQNTSQEDNLIQDFKISPVGSIFLKDSITMEFVKDYISLPENIHRKVFTLLFDQIGDSLSMTIWRYPFREVNLERFQGYFKCEGRIVLIYSPFKPMLAIIYDQTFLQEITKLYQSELEYFKDHKHQLVMWQLLYSIHEKKYKTVKSYNKIVNSIKVSFPDSIKVDIQWPSY